ncbi:DNA-binding response regulator [Iodidimonas gelatinilytica]|uniref:DNA-binding response regulator n=1 Tax=Iodidimonas gelatinilytica TaxID=1236966 RepID=A0A5A7MXX9_9PROT|nr:response regulator transcription factor [Iodidimonas gelatinilytica]GEQ98024.1 DNA-binding response regulator [Iodidimonas gelatinilytica]GEQ99859.1 DNA-binding response regulator [Iodidimonas gelatinilytica]
MSRALIIDGYELFRISLREILSATGQFDDIDEVASSGDFISAVTSEAPVTLAVIHPYSIGLNESECLRLFRRVMPNAHIVVFRDKDTAETPAPADKNITILPRDANSDDVRDAALGAYSRPDKHMDTAAPLSKYKSKGGWDQRNATEHLSKRQREIMAMVAEGMANKEIAHRIGIAEGTVKAHIHAVFRALGVNNRTQAVVRYGSALRHSGY